MRPHPLHPKVAFARCWGRRLPKGSFYSYKSGTGIFVAEPPESSHKSCQQFVRYLITTSDHLVRSWAKQFLTAGKSSHRPVRKSPFSGSKSQTCWWLEHHMYGPWWFCTFLSPTHTAKLFGLAGIHLCAVRRYVALWTVRFGIAVLIQIYEQQIFKNSSLQKLLSSRQPLRRVMSLHNRNLSYSTACPTSSSKRKTSCLLVDSNKPTYTTARKHAGLQVFLQLIRSHRDVLQ